MHLLLTIAHNAVIRFQDTVASWEAYSTQMEVIDDLLAESEAHLPEDVATSTTVTDLHDDLARCAQVSKNLTVSANKMAAAQKAAHQLLAELPAGAAKTAVQKQILSAQDKYQQ